MLVLALLSLAVSVFDLIYLYGSLRSPCRVEPDNRSIKIWVWTKADFKARIVCPNKLYSVASASPDLSVHQSGDGDEYRFVFDPPHHGVFRDLAVRITRFSLFRLFSSSELRGVGVEITVYPETLYWVRLAYLAISGGSGFGLEHGVLHSLYMLLSRLRGPPGEYMGSREYSPGDDLRFMDWKATARRLRLYIKEYSSLSGLESVDLFLDYRCLNPRSCDELASAALSAALTLYILGVGASIRGLDGGGAKDYPGPVLRGRGIVVEVLKRVVSLAEDRLSEVFEYIDPDVSLAIRRIIQETQEADSRGSRLGVRYPREPRRVRGDLALVVSSIIGCADRLVELAESEGDRMIVVTPTRPWLGRDIEESYLAYTTYVRVARALRRLGVEIYSWRDIRARGELR